MWNLVLCSDETKYTLFGSDDVQFVRRPVRIGHDYKYQKPTD